MPAEPLLTFTDVAGRLGCSPGQLYKRIREGQFPQPRKTAAGWRYTEEDWSAYLILAGRWGPCSFAIRNAGEKVASEE